MNVYYESENTKIVCYSIIININWFENGEEVNQVNNCKKDIKTFFLNGGLLTARD